MTSYLIAGGAVSLIAALTSLTLFSYRAGRNSARVKSEQRAADNAAQTSKAAQNMLNARTNGLRSNDELRTSLKKGKF